MPPPDEIVPDVAPAENPVTLLVSPLPSTSVSLSSTLPVAVNPSVSLLVYSVPSDSSDSLATS